MTAGVGGAGGARRPALGRDPAGPGGPVEAHGFAPSARDVAGALVAFVHALRAHGLSVGSHQVLTYLRGLVALDPGTAADLYWAGRAALLTHREQIPVYDELFRAWFLEPAVPERVAPRSDVDAGEPDEREQAVMPAQDPADAAPPDDPAEAGAAASAWEVLRDKHVRPCTPTERRLVADLSAGLVTWMPRRRTRRTVRAARGRRPDLRRSLRDALHTHGDVIDLAWRARADRPRPLVVLVDVSGSMAAHSRAVLLFGHAARRGLARAEVFCFGTRLTRVTEAIGRRAPEAALEATAEVVFDWEGGTRIGESLRAFLAEPVHVNLARGAVVVVCSDALERGDPAVLAAAMARLARLAYRVLWVNPLAVDPRFRPETRGMRAVLPSIDALLPAADLPGLRAVVDELARLDAPRRRPAPAPARAG